MSLEERALLVKLSISVWRNQASDRAAVAEIARTFQVTHNEGDRYIKSLVTPRALNAVLNTASSLYHTHLRFTLPWRDRGVRILPADQLFVYRERIDEGQEDFDEAVRAFIAEYPQLVQDAERARGQLFDASLYPAIDELQRSFGVQLDLLPFPASDFRLEGISQEERARLQSEAQAVLDAGVAKATEGLVEGLRKRLEALSRMLHGVFKPTQLHFRLVEEEVAYARTMNVMHAADVARLCDTIEERLGGHSASRLRHSDPAVRKLCTGIVDSLLEECDQWPQT